MKKLILSVVCALLGVLCARAEVRIVKEQCYPAPGQKISKLDSVTITLDYSDLLTEWGVSKNDVRVYATVTRIGIYKEDLSTRLAQCSGNLGSGGTPGITTFTLPLKNSLSLEEGETYFIKFNKNAMCVSNGLEGSSDYEDVNFPSDIDTIKFYGEKAQEQTDFGTITVSLREGDSKYADNAEMNQLPLSKWTEVTNETDLQPGDEGVWFLNLSSDKVDPLPEMYVTYKFEADLSTEPDWAMDNNGSGQKRVAVKTENGYLCHLWSNYAAYFLKGETVTVTIEVRENAEGNVLATQTLTWKGSLEASLKYADMTFDPANESELSSLTTWIKVSSKEALSRLEAYSPDVVDRNNLNENNEPTLKHARVNYTVAMANRKEWYVKVDPGQAYIDSSNGSINVALVAYDTNNIPALDGTYKLLSYSYGSESGFDDGKVQLTVSPVSGSTLEEVGNFVLDYERTGRKSVGREWNCQAKATLKGGDYTYEFGDNDFAGMTATFKIPADKKPTVAGLYTLTIPEGYLIVGDSPDDKPNAALEAVYAFIPATAPVEVHDTVRDTVYVNVNVPVHDTVYVNVPVHDTVYVNVPVHDTVRDTVYVNVNVPVHDTVYVGETTVTIPAALVKLTTEVSGMASTETFVAKDSAAVLAVTVADELWTVESVKLDGADLAAGTDGRFVTPALKADAKAVVTLKFDGEVVVGEEGVPTNLEGADWSGIAVSSRDGKITVIGLQSGDNVALYTVSGARLASATARQSNIVFTAPVNALYIVTIQRANKHVAVKLWNR